MLLRVIEIFDSLQGEGYWTGVPMTFVRLAGCDAFERGLDCVQWCDTPGSWDPEGGSSMEVAEIAASVQLPRVCVTGGEPLLQVAGVAALVAEMQRREIRVHVETNGTIDPPADEALRFDWAVVSPKPPSYVIAPGWDGRVDELKLVVDDHMGEATAERLAAEHPEAFVSVQAVWEKAPAGGDSARRAVTLVMSHPEWRLSLQIHKLLGIR